MGAVFISKGPSRFTSDQTSPWSDETAYQTSTSNRRCAATACVWYQTTAMRPSPDAAISGRNASSPDRWTTVIGADQVLPMFPDNAIQIDDCPEGWTANQHT